MGTTGSTAGRVAGKVAFITGAGGGMGLQIARDLTEAILWHGGEAQAARDRFAAMTKEERTALLAFLSSL